MKVLIINTYEASLQSTDTLRKLEEDLTRQNWTVQILSASTMKIAHCIGCWSCWWKDPGTCAIKDDMIPILDSFIHADAVIFASPMVMGFVSPLMKDIVDRLIPHVHPYIEIREGEMSHQSRYDKYPALGLILGDGSGVPASRKVISDWFERTAWHFQAKHLGTVSFVEGQVMINAIDHH